MMKKILTGQSFGHLTVVEDLPGYKVRCRCACGSETVTSKGHVQSGHTRSCGCHKKAVIAAGANTRHGCKKSKETSTEYRIWINIKSRCYNPNVPAYAHYGGRGILMCSEWKDSFLNFLTDMGHRPSEKYTMERRDNNLGYSPDNCTWATSTEQVRNRRNTKRVDFKGESRIFAELCEQYNMPYTVVRDRISDGWEIDRALTAPIRVTSRTRRVRSGL